VLATSVILKMVVSHFFATEITVDALVPIFALTTAHTLSFHLLLLVPFLCCLYISLFSIASWTNIHIKFHC